MEIIKPYARLLAPGGAMEFTREDGMALLRKIEWCGRVSHRTEGDALDENTPDSWERTERFIRAVVYVGGFSTFPSSRYLTVPSGQTFVMLERYSPADIKGVLESGL